MKSSMTRRAFMKSSSLGLTGLGLASATGVAIEPFKRQGPPRLALSLAAYSFRQYFKDASHAQDKAAGSAKRIDLFDFINFCADHGCQGTELTSYYFPKDVTRELLVQLRRRAFLRGIAISGTAVGNTFTHPAGPGRDEEIASVKRWIDHAAVLGAPHIRVFAGNASADTTREEATKRCVEALEICCDYAGRHGIFLGLENHGGIVAEAPELLEIVKAVRSPWLGINLDTGNFHTADPYADIEACAPYAVNIQIKAEMSARGQKKSLADLPRLIRILREARYQGFVVLEYESAEDPWKAVPVLLGELRAAMA
jgi:sugar phosphate isomerase/epimerase